MLDDVPYRTLMFSNELFEEYVSQEVSRKPRLANEEEGIFELVAIKFEGSVKDEEDIKSVHVSLTNAILQELMC